MIIFKKGEILSKNEKWKLVEETGVKKWTKIFRNYFG
jgi:hypothetical protein